MIRIRKQAEPQVLAQNKEVWTLQLLTHLRDNQDIPKLLVNKYNHQEVKEALRNETHGKCMYCESPIRHVTFEHIEHIKPKARDKHPELTFEWTNLGLACPSCNMNKGEDYSEATPFVNPYVDDPPNHFVALGPFVYHKPGDERAELTENTIKLNRAELVERRVERINMIRLLADRIATVGEPSLKRILQEQMAIEVGQDKPYSFCATSAFNHLLV